MEVFINYLFVSLLFVFNIYVLYRMKSLISLKKLERIVPLDR